MFPRPLLLLFSLELFIEVSTLNTSGCAYSGPSGIDLFIPHPRFCNLFYRLDSCPEGLYFNEEINICDIPKNTKCLNQKSWTNPGVITPTTTEPPPVGTQRNNFKNNQSFTTERGPLKPNASHETDGIFIGGLCRSKFKCPDFITEDYVVYLPHLDNCHYFCGCTNSKSELYRCLRGLHFNARTNKCDHPSLAGCKIKEPENGTIDIKPVIEEVREGILINGNCIPKHKCTEQTLVPHKESCSLFCGCTNRTHLLYQCLSGLHFNPISRKCDFPSKAGCIDTKEVTEKPKVNGGLNETVIPQRPIFIGGKCLPSKSCPRIESDSTIFIAHKSVCNLLCGCNRGRPLLYRCQKGLHFNSKTSECDFPSRAGCKIEDEIDKKITANITAGSNCPTKQFCPAIDPTDYTVYLPNEEDCSLFCRCDHGISKLEKCSKGLHFNPRKQLCDKPNNSVCKSVNNSTRPIELVPGRGVGVDYEVCPVEGICPQDRIAFLPHENNCNLFCECSEGVPKLRRCPPGLHFSPSVRRCETPRTARCQGECNKLQRRNETLWEPASCITNLSKLGEVCHISCGSGYELLGSSRIHCTAQGWNTSRGLNKLPSCKAPEVIAIDIIENIEQQLTFPKVNFLFVLDTSTSLDAEKFETQKSFVRALVTTFPLSSNHSAGIIKFSGSASVEVPLVYNNTCNFLSATKTIVFTGGATDILLALVTASKEIRINSPDTMTLIFLITDGKSETVPNSEAVKLKNLGHVLFTIGIGEYERGQLEKLASPGKDGAPLFYGLTNFDAFSKIAEYLHTVQGYGVNLNCKEEEEIPDIAV